MDFDKVVELVHETKSIIERLSDSKNIKRKSEFDFVTETDLAISKFLHGELSALYPQTGFMSEEEDISELPPDRWILDPIDGTTNLIYNYALSSVSLALCRDEDIVFGVVYNPFSDETFTAVKGEGAYYNGKKMSAAPDRDLRECLIEFGAGATHKDEAEKTFALAENVFRNCLDLRRMCSSALAICYIAQGRLNGYFEKVLKPWDYAAAALIARECGITLTDWTGAPMQFARPQSIICGTPKAYRFLSEAVKEFV